MLLTKGQVANPNVLFSILTDLLTDIENIVTQVNALVVDTADQRVAIEQSRVDQVALEIEVDAGSHGTTAVTQVATETLTATAVAARLTKQGDAKSNDPSHR